MQPFERLMLSVLKKLRWFRQLMSPVRENSIQLFERLLLSVPTKLISRSIGRRYLMGFRFSNGWDYLFRRNFIQPSREKRGERMRLSPTFSLAVFRAAPQLTDLNKLWKLETQTLMGHWKRRSFFFFGKLKSGILQWTKSIDEVSPKDRQDIILKSAWCSTLRRDVIARQCYCFILSCRSALDR